MVAKYCKVAKVSRQLTIGEKQVYKKILSLLQAGLLVNS